MKRNFLNKTSLAAIFYIPTVISVVLFAVFSCSSSKENTVGSPDFSHSSQFRKGGHAITKPLFMKSVRANLEFLDEYGFAKMYGVPTDAVERSVLVLPEDDYLLEFVEFPGFDDTITADSIINKYKYLEAIPHLADAVRTASVRFASVRKGMVDADFRISVPTDLLSPRWRVVLYPTLIQNDSISELQPLLITGEQFALKQDFDEFNYQKIIKSVVDSSKYGTLFLDYRKSKKDLDKLQNSYWKNYNEEWNKQVAYEQWKLERTNQNAYNAAREIGSREKDHHEHALRALEQVTRDYVDGKDTTGLYAKYVAEYDANSKQQEPKPSSTIDISDVPKEYRNIFESGRTLSDLKNYSVAPQDSMLIAKYRYYFDEIALNEMAQARKEEIRREIIKYPEGEYTNLCLDTILVDTDRKLEYHFRQRFEVTPGMEKIRVALRGKVEADDLSGFKIAGSDTLTYYVSNLVGLADSTLSYTEIKLFRNVYDELSIIPKFKAAQHNIDIEYMDNAAQVDSILTAYNKNRYERGLIIDSVIMTASSSLEGPYDRNLDIARKRSISMKEYLKKVLPPDANVEEVFSARYIGEDWAGAKREIEINPNIRFKSQILKLLDESVFPDQTEQGIAKRYGVDYGIIYKDIYPKLRKIDIIFNMSRPYMGVADSIYARVNVDYANALEHMKKQEYVQALEILDSRADYNTALCYAGLSQNQKAYDLLKELEPNASVEYLLALVAYNVGHKEEAAQHLANACNLDFKKIYRIPLDVEATKLLKEFNLQEEFTTILKEKRASGEDQAKEESVGSSSSSYDPYDDERVGRKVEDGELIIVN